MKSVLRSAKPYWIYIILTGKKTVEVGKDFPKSTDWSKTVEMYCSKDMRSFNRIPEKDREWMQKYLGKVACRFVCNRIGQIEYQEKYLAGLTSRTVLQFFADKIKSSCLTLEELNAYGKGRLLYGWHISDLKIYDKPRELSEFAPYCNPTTCEKCRYFHSGLVSIRHIVAVRGLSVRRSRGVMWRSYESIINRGLEGIT